MNKKITARYEHGFAHDHTVLTTQHSIILCEHHLEIKLWATPNLSPIYHVMIAAINFMQLGFSQDAKLIGTAQRRYSKVCRCIGIY